MFTATNDTTARVVGERRLDTLRALGAVSAVQVTSADQAADAAATALAGNSIDLPYALVCLGTTTDPQLRVAASIGVPDDSPVFAAARDPSRSLHQAMRTGEAVALSTDLRPRFLGALQALPGGLEPDTAVVLLLAGAGGAPSPGVLAAVHLDPLGLGGF